MIIRTYYELIKVDSSLCEVSYPCLEDAFKDFELLSRCLHCSWSADDMRNLSPAPVYQFQLAVLFPPTMDRPADDCECNLKETMSLFNELQGAEIMRRPGVLKLADIY